MTSPATSQSTFDLLNGCIQALGAAVIAIWGVDDDGKCLCPKGKDCRSPGKHPNAKLCPNGVKNATRDPSILRQWVRQAPRGNWAIRCGEPIPGGGFLGAFDWDPRNGSDESLAEIQGRGDELPDTVTQASGGGGGHRLYKFPHSPESRCLGPGLDLQGGGKYIVVAPSRHYTGGFYSWELGAGPGDVQIADAPQWMLDGTGKAVPRPERDSADTARETVLGEAFTLAGRGGPVMPDGTMFVNCVQSHLHGDTRGRGEDASTVILPPAGGSRFGGYKCFHGHCANLKWNDVLKMLPKEHVEEAYRKYPRLGVVPPPKDEAETDGERELVADGDVPGESLESAMLPDSAKELAEIRQKLHFKTSGKGYKIINDIINANIVLTHDPRWKGILKFDEFAQVLRFTRDAPWHPDDAPKEKNDVWMDSDVMRLDLWFRRNWSLELPAEKIRESVYVVGRRDAFNPLQDYLNGLVWDEQRRLDTWLSTYGGCADNDYARSAGKKWLLSAVARAFEPGCKVDTLLVLEGPQGKGKSTLIRSLVPQVSWFSDTPIDLASKDAYVALRGKWIIELAELASLKKADLDRTKAFFSSPVDSYRPPYGREMVSIPRTCIFAGTVNLGTYLNDSTGARRFWPVRCGVIDLEALIRDRDQLWAEAVDIYKAWVGRGRPQSECLWWPSSEETSMFEVQQTEREISNPWTEAVALFLKSERGRTLVEKRGYILIREVARDALNIDDKDLTVSDSTNIGIILSRELGWQRKRVHIAGARSWGYSPSS